MASKLSAHARRIEIKTGKERAIYNNPKNSDEDNNKTNNLQFAYYIRASPTPAQTCDHCDTVAEAAGTSPSPRSDCSVWDLEEVDEADLEGAVWVVAVQLQQAHNIILATIRLKYHKRRRRVRRFGLFGLGGVGAALLVAAEKIEYGRKQSELEAERQGRAVEYGRRMRAKIEEHRRRESGGGGGGGGDSHSNVGGGGYETPASAPEGVRKRRDFIERFRRKTPKSI